jgi:hypothetical protein
MSILEMEKAYTVVIIKRTLSPVCSAIIGSHVD